MGEGTVQRRAPAPLRLAPHGLLTAFCAGLLAALARGAPVAAALDDVAVWEAGRAGRPSE